MTKKWKEINLPWYTYDHTKLPVRPDTSDIPNEYPDKEFLARMRSVGSWDHQKSGIVCDIVNQIQGDIQNSSITEEIISRAKENYPGNEYVETLLRYRQGLSAYNVWYNEKYIKDVRYTKWSHEYAKANELEMTKSFQTCGLCKAGTQIEVKFPFGVTKKYLIGDINTQGGVCDDCRDFSNEDIVLRYRVLIDEETDS
jgi:hypothetical protein